MTYTCPDCPLCGNPPSMVLSPQQAFCDNEHCSAFCWDMTMTAAENRAVANVIDLSGFDQEEK